MSTEPPRPLPAVVDGIEEGVARLLVGQAGDAHWIDAARLPEGVGEGDAVSIHLPASGTLEEGHFEADPAATRLRRQRIRGKLDELRRRRPGTDESP